MTNISTIPLIVFEWNTHFCRLKKTFSLSELDSYWKDKKKVSPTIAMLCLWWLIWGTWHEWLYWISCSNDYTPSIAIITLWWRRGIIMRLVSGITFFPWNLTSSWWVTFISFYYICWLSPGSKLCGGRFADNSLMA